MWKKASLPQMLLLPLLLLPLNALLLVQLVATESTQPSLNAKDINTNINSSTDHAGAKALDIHDDDDDHDAEDHDWDEEAIVETYDGDGDEVSSEVERKATPLYLMINRGGGAAATNQHEEEADTYVHEHDYHDTEIHVHDDIGGGGSGDYVDVGSGGGDNGAIEVEDIGVHLSSGSGDDAAVVADNNDNDDDTDELTEVDISERKRIASIMLRELSKIVDYALEQQRSVVNEFLQDETIEMVKCATMVEVKQSCNAFMGGVRYALQLDKGDNMITQLLSFGVKTLTAYNFEQFVRQHNTTLIEQPTAENVLIINALKKAGVMHIELELEKRFLEFSKLFNTTVSAYVKQRVPQLVQQTEQQQQQQQKQINDKLVLWYGEFAVATNVSSQMLALTKFFPMYKKIILNALKD